MTAVISARASLRKDFVYWLSGDFLKNLLQFFILPIADCRLPIADCRLPIADCRLPIADCRLPIADYTSG
jgi:hypothetical protein